MAFRDTDELTCPRCGERIDGDADATPAIDSDDEVRTLLDCPECDAPLELVIDDAEDALGVDVWLEDRERPTE